jgi:mevalonate kinase
VISAAAALTPELRVTVPGKVMLAGEYAVLEGEPALAVTTTRAMTITVMRHAQRHLGTSTHASTTLVSSDLWAASRSVGQDSAGDEPLEQLVRELHLQGRPPERLHVDAALTPSWGIGSSSALRLGVLLAGSLAASDSAQNKFNQSDFTQNDFTGKLWTSAAHALRLQRAAQPGASGYDICTQARGGLVLFQPTPQNAPMDADPLTMAFAAKSLPLRHANLLRVMVGGAGAPTAATMKTTIAWLRTSGNLDVLVRISRELVQSFVPVLSGDAVELGQLLRAIEAHRTLMSGSPSFPPRVAEILNQTSGLGTTWSWKTTGAGGEDALLLVGKPENTEIPAQKLRLLGWTDLPDGLDGSRMQISSGGVS